MGRGSRKRDKSKADENPLKNFWTFLVGLILTWTDSIKKSLEGWRTSVASSAQKIAESSNRETVELFFANAKERTSRAINHAYDDPMTAAKEAAAAIRTTAQGTQVKAGEFKDSAVKGAERVQRFSDGVKEALTFYVEDAQAMYRDVHALYRLIAGTVTPKPQSYPPGQCCGPCVELNGNKTHQPPRRPPPSENSEPSEAKDGSKRQKHFNLF